MTNKFSYKIKTAFIALAMVGMSSCEVTDLQPATIIPDEEAFTDASRINAAVLGIYEAAQRGFYLGSVQRGYPFGAASTQQGDMRGEDMYNDQLFYEITYINGHTPQSANNNGQWISLYRMINRANIVIENLDQALADGVLTEAERNTFRGEALYLRALAHHELVVFFARPYSDNPSSMGIPYRTFAINDVSKVQDGEAVGRGTVESVYQQLLADLDEAEELLPTSGNAFRARSQAAIGLKSRVKLHMQDWQGVIDEYTKLAGELAVTEDPLTPFRGGTSSDNIFSFENTDASNAGVNGALPNMYGSPDLGARGLVKISPVIWTQDFWLENDSRRSVLGEEDGMVTVGDLGIFTNKYVDNTTFSDPTVIQRFAEVVLSAAEAHARLGNTGEAVSLLNQVRDRAVPAGASYTAAGLGGVEEVIDAIIQERRIEFLAEGRRFPDIHRLAGEGRIPGIPQKAASRSVNSIDFYTGDEEITLDHALEYSSNLFVWPVPQEEILNNASAPIEQNPGY
ncbi:RagB/SusD family nutrient uptake outer membrane protein [Litoribacter populi]|uniref:RagB/SusD family nutrient uptake outer membrane protein n=1 Tax=Litoribacter populi TaxID=2598460 RepID=UPI001F438352|nr:RagB/SusD family nutrient uptake outer membrane protein [Litoribacter populi]